MAQQQTEDKPQVEQVPEDTPETTSDAPVQADEQNPPTEQAVPETPDSGAEEVAKTAPDSTSATPDIAPETSGFSVSGLLDNAKELAAKVFGQIFDWLTSPAFLVMVAMVVLGYYLARLITKNLIKRVDFFREQPKDGKLLRLKKIAWQLRDLIFPAVLIVLYAAASPVLQNIPFLGQDWLVKIAQGLAVVFLLYTAIKRFIKHPLVQKAVIWIAIPAAVLKVFGWFDEFQTFLQDDATLELGNISIPAWSVANILIFGSILFWVGRISNSKGKEVIQKQESIDAGTREVFSKIFEMILFGVLFVLLMLTSAHWLCWVEPSVWV